LLKRDDGLVMGLTRLPAAPIQANEREVCN
jgi:hypothetical protein